MPTIHDKIRGHLKTRLWIDVERWLIERMKTQIGEGVHEVTGGKVRRCSLLFILFNP